MTAHAGLDLRVRLAKPTSEAALRNLARTMPNASMRERTTNAFV